jgi:hypothetical protein
VDDDNRLDTTRTIVVTGTDPAITGEPPEERARATGRQ